MFNFRVLPILILLLWPALSQGETYSLVRIPVSGSESWLRLQRLGLALEEGVRWTRDGIEVVLSDTESTRVRNAGFQTLVLKPDVIADYRLQSRKFSRSPSAPGSMGGYYTYAETLQRLQQLHQKYKTLLSSPIVIGASIEGRQIIAVKISDHVDQEEPDEPEVLYTALHHAREPLSLMSVMYFMERLLQGYNKDPETTYLVNHRQLWFVPIANPDGYVYNEQTNPAGGGLWRKNRRRNADGSYGVDLNRNYGYRWGYNDEGSSPNGLEENYRGTSAFSEPESQVLRDFVQHHRFRTAMNYHSFCHCLIYPWNYSTGKTPQQALFNSIADWMTRFNGWSQGTAFNVLGYSANGDLDDWLFGASPAEARNFALTPEIGTNFWPPHTSILAVSKEAYFPNLAAAWTSGAYPVIAAFPPASSDPSHPFRPGETYTFPLKIRNLGLSENTPELSVRLVPLSRQAKVETAPIDVAPIKPFQFRNNAGHVVFISPAAVAGQQIPFAYWIESDGKLLRKDTFYIQIASQH